MAIMPGVLPYPHSEFLSIHEETLASIEYRIDELVDISLNEYRELDINLDKLAIYINNPKLMLAINDNLNSEFWILNNK